LRCRRAGDHISADRYAVECARDAPATSGWTCVPGGAGIRGKEVELAASGVDGCNGDFTSSVNIGPTTGAENQ
jgi:hypothetical protein